MKKKTLIILMLILSICIYKNAYAEDMNTKVYIDYPTEEQQVKDVVKIQGWVMSKVSNTTLKVYIDNEEIEVDRQTREDVYKAVTGYGTREENPNNGFIKEVDIRNKSYGEHIVKVEVRDNLNNVLARETKKFIRQKPKTKAYIDYPTINQQMSDTVKIQGWVMSETPSTIKIYIDNELIEVDRQSREDVYRAVTGYGTREENPNNGFVKEIDIKNKAYGEHTVKIKVYDEYDNLLIIETQKFIRKAPKTKAYIDYPIINQHVKNTLKIQGWVMSTSKNTKLKVYMDNQEVEVNRQKREDVYRAITGYGTREENPNNGFIKEIDLRNIIYGEHIVKIEVLDEFDKVLITETRKFIRDFPNNKINIDLPAVTSVGEKILINGWYLCEEENTSIEIYLDGEKIEDYEKKERPDVYRVYPNEYGRVTQYPGFKAEINALTKSDGKHTVVVKILSKDNRVIGKETKSFNLKKVNGTMYIDFLEQSHKKVGYYLSGWEMSTEEGSYIKTYIDNQEVNYDYGRRERNDVISAIKGYGDRTVNSNPGYIGYVDISTVRLGEHNLKVVLYSKYNEEITSINQRINIVTKQYEVTNGVVNKLQYDVIYYNQYDGRWANNVYGLAKFGSTGCAPSSMAMAFSGILGKTFTPVDIANYLYYNTNEYNKYMKGTSGIGLMYATDAYHIKRTGINSLGDLNRELQAGKLVFCAMGNGIYGSPFWNHAIIVKGYNNGKTYSYDPLKTSNNMWIDTSIIWSQRSVDSDDYRGGSVFYALESYN